MTRIKVLILAAIFCLSAAGTAYYIEQTKIVGRCFSPVGAARPFEQALVLKITEKTKWDNKEAYSAELVGYAQPSDMDEYIALIQLMQPPLMIKPESIGNVLKKVDCPADSK